VDIRKIGVIGSGLMGSGIAQVCSQGGLQVVMTDMDENSVKKGFETIEKSLARFVKAEKIGKDKAESILRNIRGTTEIEEAGADADFVIEAVTEKLDTKIDIFGQLDELCPIHTILASNTSGIMITDIAAGTKRPERVIGMHWFYPAPMMKCIEVVKGALTSDEVCDKVKELSIMLGKEPVLVNDGPGFFTTRFIDIWLLEAVRLFEAGIAGIEEIDKLSRLSFGWPMGPIELIDFVGLDTFVHAISYLYAETGDSRFVPPLTVKKLVKSGYIGKKPGSKGGFYEYYGIERKK